MSAFVTDPPVAFDISCFGTSRAAFGEYLRYDTTTAPTLDIQHVVQPDDVLQYAVRPLHDATVPEAPPAAGWRAGGYASTGVGLRITTADGDEHDADLVDQYGVDLRPASQGESMLLAADQWNRRRIALGSLTGQKITRISLQVDESCTAAGGWVDGFSIAPAPDRPTRPCEWVDTRRGSNSSMELSRGNTVPTVSLPNGFAFLTPLTNAESRSWPYEWAPPGGLRFAGVALAHLPTPWLGDRGVVHVFGTDGASEVREIEFDHRDEVAQPHRYHVRLEDGAQVEVAPMRTGGAVRFTFPSGCGAVTLQNLTSQAELRVLDDGVTIVGFTDEASPLASDSPRMHFAVRFGNSPVDCSSVDANGAGGVRLAFNTAAVELRIASSFLSVEQALGELETEDARAGMVGLTEVAADAWDALLGRITIDTDLDEDRVILHSNLYRIFLYPNEAHERVESGDAYAAGFTTPGGAGAPRPGRLTVNNGFWDTYRTLWPLYAVLAPDRCASLLEGFLPFFRDAGWLPRWSAPGPVDCMVGTSSDIVYADSLARGVQLEDAAWEEAYDAALKNACVPSHLPATGRKGIAESRFRGYVSDDVPEGLSWTLEAAVCDFAISRMSRNLLDRWGQHHPRSDELQANERYFASRAQSYRLLFDHARGFFRGRNAEGEMRGHFDPLSWGGDYTETNAWGMAFSAPHDGTGLARLHGGPAGLRAKLDEYFETPEQALPQQWGSYAREIHEMVEARSIRMGQFALSNQPSHHVPFMYAYSDAPHRTQRITREALRRQFTGSDLGQGYPGDEDNGEMSAWWIWCALGLYPLAVGDPSYVITSPRFRRMTLSLPDGAIVEVVAHGVTDGDYVQSVEVDGEPWHSLILPHERLAGGCRIDIVLGAQPREWEPQPAPAAVEPLEDVTRMAIPAGDSAATLGDDVGGVDVRLPAGTVVEWRLPEQHRLALFTLTCGTDPSMGPDSWRFEGQDADGRWHVISRVVDWAFRWPSQTAAFCAEKEGQWCGVRFVLESGDATLQQLEVLADGGQNPIRSTSSLKETL